MTGVPDASAVVITPAQARAIVLRHMGLSGSWVATAGSSGVTGIVERLGYVQIDTISVVARAHDQILWARHPEYSPALLEEAYASRALFEGWGWDGVAAYLPLADYPYYLAAMRRYAHRERTRAWLREHEALVDEVLGRIREQGPLGSADLPAPEGFVRGNWWSWKPAKRALEVLFAAGVLMVAGRKGFQRQYDLAERVLPSGVELSEPTRDRALRWMVLRAAGAQGLVAIPGRWANTRERRTVIDALVAEGSLVRVQVDGTDGRPLHALPESLEGAVEAPSPDGRVHLLSPFDPLVSDRRRALELFGFDYRLECYVPAAQRRYGYYTLPVLWGSRLVARLEAKAERRAKVLSVSGLYLEEDAPGDGGVEAFSGGLADTLRDYATLNGCAGVSCGGGVPEPYLTLLAGALLQ